MVEMVVKAVVAAVVAADVPVAVIMEKSVSGNDCCGHYSGSENADSDCC